MTDDAPAGDDEQLDPSEPLLFISHRHADSDLADAVKEFVSSSSGGRVTVFQSSSATAEGPRIGENLNQELGRRLYAASVVILIYTTEDQDWSYCMWECGRAYRARIIFFQCGSRFPAVFADQVRVNIRDRVDIQKFTNDFLTSPDFFPRFGEAISRFAPNDPNVLRASDSLFENLTRVLPPADSDGVDEWPAYPYLRLELTKEHVLRIREESEQGRLDATTALLQEARVTDGDGEAARIFGMRSISRDAKFEQCTKSWKDAFPQTEPNWLIGLSEQVMVGAQGRFPTLRWELMRAVDPNDGTW
jgi:hypothetical protein